MFRSLAKNAMGAQMRHFSASRVHLMPVFFTRSHEWVKIEDGEATMGITQVAQERLGEVVYIDLPEVGDEVTEGEEYGTVESVKATAPLIAPVAGVVAERNDELLDNTSLVNESPEARAWMVKLTDFKQPEEKLMSSEEYEQYIASDDCE